MQKGPKTIRAQNGVYQTNVRVDPLTHEKIKFLKIFYEKQLIGKPVNDGALLRRAVSLLTDHIDNLVMEQRRSTDKTSASIERIILNESAKGHEISPFKDPSVFQQFPTFTELKTNREMKKMYNSEEYIHKSLN